MKTEVVAGQLAGKYGVFNLLSAFVQAPQGAEVAVQAGVEDATGRLFVIILLRHPPTDLLKACALGPDEADEIATNIENRIRELQPRGAPPPLRGNFLPGLVQGLRTAARDVRLAVSRGGDAVH